MKDDHLVGWKPEYLCAVLDMCFLINQSIKLELMSFRMTIDQEPRHARNQFVTRCLTDPHGKTVAVTVDSSR